jgi:hypothetical protein
MHGSYLGPADADADIETFLRSVGAVYERAGSDEELVDATARLLADEKVVGWFQGRMEFGPRALGGRSILGDPRSTKMQSVMNLKIKYRESFRPFAPAILEERVKDYFKIEIPSPYMLLVMPVTEDRQLNRDKNAAAIGLEKLRVARSDVPAVTHVDYSVRLQTVTRQRNGFFYDVVNSFSELTGCPMIVNTSGETRPGELTRAQICAAPLVVCRVTTTEPRAPASSAPSALGASNRTRASSVAGAEGGGDSMTRVALGYALPGGAMPTFGWGPGADAISPRPLARSTCSPSDHELTRPSAPKRTALRP